MRLAPVVAIMALALAGTAHAVPSTPPLTPTSFFFDCTTETKVGTAVDDTEAFTWSSTAPSASFTTGEGCGWADPPFSGTNQPNPFYDAAWGGLYKGEINKIELNLYSLFNVPAFGEKIIDLNVIVDGEIVYTGSQLAAPTEPAGQAAVKTTFTVSELEIPATKNDKYIVIAVSNYVPDGMGAWVHGASEVPAGVRLFDSDDLTCEEQQYYDETLVCD